MLFDEIVGKFENIKRCAGGVTARCPAHDDRENSVKLSRSKDKSGNDCTLIHCHRGCKIDAVLGAIGITLADLYPVSRNGAGTHQSNGTGARLTLQQFAKAKGLDSQFLGEMGVSEDKGALVFHYLLMNGQRAARQRILLSLSGDKRFIWNKAEGRPVPYGHGGSLMRARPT
jgi:hypothetical protein